MSARLLLSGTLTTAAVRRTRRVDDRLYAVFDMRDTDRGEARRWRVYANDLDLIERVEELRVGEPVCACGPFSISVENGQPVYRMTAEAMVDTKRRKKPKGLIAKEQRTAFDELDLAPIDPELNDPLPDWGQS